MDKNLMRSMRLNGVNCIWFIFFTLYFNLVANLLIILIWSLTFQYHINLVTVIIFLIEIADVTNNQCRG